MLTTTNSLSFKADGTDGIYADKPAEAHLKTLGHSLPFYRHGEGTCWTCGRRAKLEQTRPAEGVWTLSGPALEAPCEWASIPYADVQPTDSVSQHSVNGATYGPPEPIERLTKTQIVLGKGRMRWRRRDGRLIDPNVTSFYVSIVRRRA